MTSGGFCLSCYKQGSSEIKSLTVGEVRLVEHAEWWRREHREASPPGREAQQTSEHVLGEDLQNVIFSRTCNQVQLYWLTNSPPLFKDTSHHASRVTTGFRMKLYRSKARHWWFLLHRTLRTSFKGNNNTGLNADSSILIPWLKKNDCVNYCGCDLF